MSYDGFYGELSTRGTVNDLLSQADSIKVSIEASAAEVAADTSDVDLKHAEVTLKAAQVQTDANLVSTKAQEVQANADYIAEAVLNSSLVVIDDAAGLGTTMATWSADKSSKVLGGKVDKVTGKQLSDTNFTQVEKTKLAGVAEEATKNRADPLNADKVHSHAMAQVAGLDTALSDKASNNDPRFTDAREWTAATISQAEAEAGTATKRRSFTAQRVRQSGVATVKSMTVQVTGTSTTNIMSQKAVTDAIANIPSVPKSANYTVSSADQGKSIDTTENVTIPASVFTVGDVIVVTNNSATNISISAAAGVTLRLAGTASTGTRTLVGYGVATFRMVSNNVWFASGAGLS